MAGMLRHSHSGTDGLGRSVCPEGKPAGNITGCPGRVPGAESGRRWGQHPPRTGIPAHPASRAGQCCPSRVRHPNQTPGSRDELFLRPSGGEGGSWSRLGSGAAVLSPSSAGLGKPCAVLFPTIPSVLC